MDALNQLTDEALVQMYANGDDSAFDVLLCRYKRKVFSYINMVVKDKDVASDLFQETFIKVVSTIRQNRYKENGKFVAWLMRIAHNLVIDHFRRDSAENLVSGEADGEGEPSIFDTIQIYDKNVEDEMIEKQVYADLVKLVDSLPEAQREVLKMRFYQDLSFKEIAEATGVSINTALGRMRYALINLRTLANENHIFLGA
ncbi:MAG: sigma-70 family RNA polymerase sigma factor [Paludibacteraceae bacterium]|nr:sigma-70 family RNA polymerase sigma factor [Paludibacteraceae bacterium]